jgi:transmembrane sensor
VLIFDHATLADAVAEFNRYNRQKLLIGDSVAGHLAIYGTFRADNVEDFISLARDVLGLRTERRNSEIVIFH